MIDAVRAIESWHGSREPEGLEPIRTLLQRMGDPQNTLKFIHVAGSNGKGSTCAMLSSILQQAGYRVGLFTSPYIEDFRERIQVDGALIPQEALAAITQQTLPLAAEIGGVRQFALVTAIAMEYFRRCHCDIVVLEVGLGGIVDATNVIDTPEAAVITNIGLEHTERLGHTLTAIAEKKAGIIKHDGTAVCYDGAAEVSAVMRRQCDAVGAALHPCDFTQLTPLEQRLDGQRFRYRGQEYILPLLGRHQCRNAAVVLDTIAVLRQQGWQIPPQAVGRGLTAVRWPARFEILSREPLFILDGGHNPQCAAALADALRDCGVESVCCIMGVMDDKDAPAMIAQMLPLTKRFLCVRPNDPRALSAQRLAALIHGVPAVACASLSEALAQAKDSALPTVSFGSLYLAGEIRTLMK